MTNNNISTGAAAANGGVLSSMNRVGLGYGIAIAVGMLAFVCVMMLVCARLHAGRGPASASASTVLRRRPAAMLPRTSAAAGAGELGTIVVIHEEGTSSVTGGLDEETLESYPKFLYSCDPKEATSTPQLLPTSSCTGGNMLSMMKDSSTCPICLADYGHGDTLRLLPECSHVFHVQCIDAWLRLHVSCPLCRSSPLPTPVSTPLSELIPLARNPLA